MDDLYIIKKSKTESNHTELHILSGDSSYQDFKLHRATSFAETDNSYDFLITPHLAAKITGMGGQISDVNLYDNKGDLAFILKNNGKNTDLITLTAASDYQVGGFIGPINLGPTDNGMWAFAFDAYSNFVAVKKNSLQIPTHSGFTELFSFSQTSSYQDVFPYVTALQFSDNNFVFHIALNGDLIIIKKNGASSTEVHILSSKSHYKEFIFEQKTPLEITDENWDFVVDSKRNVIGIKKQKTGSGFTELHILSAKSNYSEFSDQIITPLGMTDDHYKFCMSLDYTQIAEINLP